MLNRAKQKIKSYIQMKKEEKIDYYIIKRKESKAGFFSIFITNLGAMDYLIKKGIPFCFGDLKSVEWNKFFQLKQNNPNFFTGKCMEFDKVVPFIPNDGMECLTNHRLIQYWHDLYKNNLRFTDEISEYIESVYNNLLADKINSTIGVICRGTDYLSLKPNEHPRQPLPEDLFPIIDKLLEKDYQYVYLVTEDKCHFSAFSKRYGKKLISVTQKRIDIQENEYLSDAIEREKIDLFTKNRDYLTSIYLLSKCNALIGGRTSGTVSAMVMSSGFKFLYLWNDGRYGDELEEERYHI